MLHLRLIAPQDCSAAVLDLLRGHVGVTHLAVFPGAGQQPPGDLVLADIAREAADDVLAELQRLGVADRGSIAVERVDLSLSAAADRAEELAPGAGGDAVLWDDLQARAREDSALGVTYLSLFAIATALAGIAVLLDSAILVVGAMIVGPEFGALVGICAGLALRRVDAVRRGAVALAVGFPVGIAAAVTVTWLLDALGLVEPAMLTEDRPQTQFIYLPDALSFVVALLAGIAGVLALTSAKSGAVLGVLVSVTTIPAAGNVAVALAFATARDAGTFRSEALDQAWTSTGQLLLNLAGVVIGGTATMFLQRGRWRRSWQLTAPRDADRRASAEPS